MNSRSSRRALPSAGPHTPADATAAGLDRRGGGQDPSWDDHDMSRFSPPRERGSLQAILEEIYRGEAQTFTPPRGAQQRGPKVRSAPGKKKNAKPPAISSPPGYAARGAVFNRVVQSYVARASSTPPGEGPLSREERRIGVLSPPPPPSGTHRRKPSAGKRSTRVAAPEEVHAAPQGTHTEREDAMGVWEERDDAENDLSAAVFTVRSLAEAMEGTDFSLAHFAQDSEMTRRLVSALETLETIAAGGSTDVAPHLAVAPVAALDEGHGAEAHQGTAAKQSERTVSPSAIPRFEPLLPAPPAHGNRAAPAAPWPGRSAPGD
ncbi:hypothetical protein T484DRAFT_1893312, partial [Baffinella frigidus]